jgi:hypothetical protein
MVKRTIVLNSKVNCGKSLNGTKNLKFYFEIPAMSISDKAKLKVVNLIHDHKPTGNSNKLNIMLKIDGVSVNNSYYFSNDGSFPTLITFDTFNPSYYIGNELTLNKQSINYINIYGSDDMADVMSGIDASVNFILILEIEENE